MLYYYQDTHYLISDPPVTIYTKDEVANSPELKRLAKWVGPGFYTSQPRKKELYSYHVYEEIENTLILHKIVYSEEELCADEIKMQSNPKRQSEEIRELCTTFDHCVLWETTLTEFRLWTPHQLRWLEEHRFINDENVTINYQSQLNKRIEASQEFLTVFHRSTSKKYNPGDFKTLYNWLGRWKCYSGIGICDRYGHSLKLLSLWNRYSVSSWIDYNSWFDLEDDIHWTRQVGAELAKILSLEWDNRLQNVMKK